jgi:cytochrome P450
MVETVEKPPLSSLPLPPNNPLPYWRRLKAARALATGPEVLRDAGGPVTRNILGPKWLMPPLVVITSPQGARDVLSRKDAFADRGTLPWMIDLRHLIGGNLLNLPHDEWLPRRRAMQPLFTKQRVTQFGGHITDAAECVSRRWPDGAEVDLTSEIHSLTLRALGRSVLGLDLDAQADAVGPAMRTALMWSADRALAPVRAPRWLPTPSQRRARRASTLLHRLAAEILQICRDDPDHDAPLVHALIAARDPETGQAFSDNDICDELVMFMFGGHDTISTVLTYALWALGRHHDMQHRVAAEVAWVGDRTLTPDDVPHLSYTVQVLHEAMRLCPPGPSLFRLVMQDIDVDGYRVEAGTYAFIGAYAMHRDPVLWDDPLTFDPGRFSPERSKGRNRWQYIPFGGGPRSCMGDHFAMLEATLALATIVRAAEINSLEDDFPTSTPFTMTPAGPICARVRVPRAVK